MTQTRLGSLYEALFNTFIGFWINFAANLLILPAFGFESLTVGTNLILGVLYTGISVARGYVVRRWFNQRLHRAAEALAAKTAG